MTREEAIEILNNVSFFAPSEINVDKAIEMAISALKGGGAEMNEIKSPFMQETPSEDGSDLISRTEALEEMAQAECGVNYEHCCEEDCACSYIQRILDIPSAERCGECRNELEDLLKQYAEVASKKKDIVAQHICDGISLSLGSIPAERVGVWEYDFDKDDHYCTRCHKYAGDWEMNLLSDYCPSCGARMENEK